MDEFGIGAPLPRLEDVRFITGRGRYTDDIPMSGLAFMEVVRSPYASARIKGFDISAAQAAPGVLLVLTGEDARAEGFGGYTSKMRKTNRQGEPNFEPPFRILEAERVRFVGDPVAIVVATSAEAARDGADLVLVDYEELPAISDIKAALAKGAPLVWDEVPNNECVFVELGDRKATAAAFAQAAHVAKGEFAISRVAHASIEPRVGIGLYDPVEDRYTLHAAVQAPHTTRNEIATRIFRIPENKLRVISPDVGGAFGGKGYSHPELALVLWAARKCDRPVKWVCTRSEAFLADFQARDNLAQVELALDANGKFLGVKVKNVLNLGAYLTNAGLQCGFHHVGSICGVYTNRNVDWEVSAVFTNTTPIIAMRGAGRPETTFMIERIIDIAAAEMSIDPAELRRRNLIPTAAIPYDTGFVHTYDSGDFEKGFDTAMRMADWAGFPERRARSQARGKLRGIGMAYAIESAAGVRDETAEIRFDTSGAVTIVVGTHSHGQSHETTFRQVVASMLGIAPKDMRMIYGDTDLTPFGRGTGASRSMTVAGSALVCAAERIIARGKQIAAHMLEVEESDIAFDAGVFTTRATNRSVDLAGIARFAHDFRQMPAHLGVGFAERVAFVSDGINFPNGCHVCEVEIDPATGETSIVGYWLSEDVGVVINPLVVKGQAVGGIAQGIGQALCEKIVFDGESAQLLTGSFMDYCMPRAKDLPAIEIKSQEVPAPNNPLGVKGAGESALVGALPAVINAICDALRPLGVKHIEMPATPARIWEAIEQARRAKAA
ncbi:MAG: xanthine dehydrogenase family protein molybdopterin-binding subunit [Hyphomonadaceae bacterium]|nr:xanthine dehydrogenase family protein molybdopterin-binding subunit [Hyphomonadaceae bacterium]